MTSFKVLNAIFKTFVKQIIYVNQRKMQSIERNIHLTELYNITESFYV
jgi:hypothetical protein